jgi:hypothetical protein
VIRAARADAAGVRTAPRAAAAADGSRPRPSRGALASDAPARARRAMRDTA